MSKQSFDKFVRTSIFYGVLIGAGIRLLKWISNLNEMSPIMHVIVNSFVIITFTYILVRFIDFLLQFLVSSHDGSLRARDNSLLLLAVLLLFPIIVYFNIIEYFEIKSTVVKIVLFIATVGISTFIHILWNSQAFRKTTVIDIKGSKNKLSSSINKFEI